MSGRDARPARVEDVHELAASMPHVVVENGSLGNPVYQVGGKSFVFFRNPRPDVVDAVTGERYDDVIVIWVESEDDKAALVQDPGSPFFTTDHFNGHRSVLVRAEPSGRGDAAGAGRAHPGRVDVQGVEPPGGRLAGRASLTARRVPPRRRSA